MVAIVKMLNFKKNGTRFTGKEEWLFDDSFDMGGMR